MVNWVLKFIFKPDKKKLKQKKKETFDFTDNFIANFLYPTLTQMATSA